MKSHILIFIPHTDTTPPYALEGYSRHDTMLLLHVGDIDQYAYLHIFTLYWLVLPPNLGIQIFHELFPASNGGASAVLAEIVSPSRISAPLDCRINYDTVLRQLSSVWYVFY